MKYRVFLENKAQKQLDNLNQDIKDVIKRKMLKLKDEFIPELDIKKLKGFKNH